MKGLVIDTSTQVMFIALLEKSQILLWETSLHNNQLSKILIPRLDPLIQGNTLAYIATGTGPGSFTGTRVGVTVAKSLSFALQIPLIGFPSLDAFTDDAQESLPSFIYEKFEKKEYSFDDARSLLINYASVT